MKFYLFRHGETDWNKEMRIQGSTDTPLNSRGVEQANLLIPKLKGLELEVIYSSDLKRAFKTGEIVANAFEIPIISDPRLREASFGEAEGKTVEEIKRLYGEDLWENFRKASIEKKDIRFPGGEGRWESVQRMRGFVNDLIERSQYRKVGIATHGGVVRNLLHSYLPKGSETLKIPNCVVYELNFENDSFKVSGPL